MYKEERMYFASKEAASIASVIAVTLAGQLSDPLEYHGHYYSVEKSCRTWLEAQAYSDSLTLVNPMNGRLLEAHLVTVNSAEEQEFVHRTFIGQEWTHAWIGAWRTSDSGALDENWVWVTGEPWEYTNWADDQPERYDEDRGSMMNFTGGTWHDYNDTNFQHECDFRYVIMEYEQPFYNVEYFDPPVRDNGVISSGTRSLPLKARLYNRLGETVTTAMAAAAPTLAIRYTPPGGAGEIPVDGAQEYYRLDYTGDSWQTVVGIDDCCWMEGSYRITVVSGDESEYRMRFAPSMVLEVTGNGGNMAIRSKSVEKPDAAPEPFRRRAGDGRGQRR